MEWISREGLEDIRYLNDCTDEEWKVISDFLVSGKCDSLEKKMICYKNIIDNNEWYDKKLIQSVIEESKLWESINYLVLKPFFVFIVFLFFKKLIPFALLIAACDIAIDKVIKKVISIKEREKAVKILSEIESQVKEQVRDIYQRDDEIIKEISNTIDRVAEVKYPGFENDLYELKGIAHQYVANVKRKEILTVAEKAAVFRKIVDLDIENKITSYQKSKKINCQVRNIVDKRLEALNNDDTVKYDLAPDTDFNTKGPELVLKKEKVN